MKKRVDASADAKAKARVFEQLIPTKFFIAGKCCTSATLIPSPRQARKAVIMPHALMLKLYIMLKLYCMLKLYIILDAVLNHRYAGAPP